MKMKIRSQRYDINRTRPRHGPNYNKDKMCPSIMILICIKQQFMKKLCKSEVELKKSVAYKKSVYFQRRRSVDSVKLKQDKSSKQKIKEKFMFGKQV